MILHYLKESLLLGQNSTSHVSIAIKPGNIKINNFGLIIPPSQSDLLFPLWILLKLRDLLLLERPTLIFERILASLR